MNKILRKIKQWFCTHEYTTPQEFELESAFGKYKSTKTYCDECFKLVSEESEYELSDEAAEIFGQPKQ